jgi:hypothetical protein
MHYNNENILEDTMKKWINELRDSVKIINHKKVSSKLIAVCEALNTLDEAQFNIQHYKNKKDNIVTYCPLGWVAKKIPSLGLRFKESSDFEGSYTLVDYDGRENIDAITETLGISLFDYVEVFSEYSYLTRGMGIQRIMPSKAVVMSRIFNLAKRYEVDEK